MIGFSRGIRMQSLCLIRPPRVMFGSYFTSGEAIPPLGMAYLASSLSSKGYDVYPIDAIGERIDQYYPLTEFKDIYVQGMVFEEIISMIPSDSLFIGVSCMFSCEWFLYEALIHQIKNVYPHIPIIVGGEHVTAEAENILKVCSAVDICVRGEGELTIIELASAIEKQSPLGKIAGILYREKGTILKTPPRERVIHIDDLPTPDWSKFPIQNYLDAGNSMTTKRRKAMPIIASRGCPYRCTFCTSPQMWGTSLHLRTPQLVVDEIKFYKETYHIEHIDFVDLVGFLNRAWVKEILTLMIQADLGVTWILGAGTRSEILDEEILGLFKKSNVLRIFYAPESGSKETLKRIKKRLNLEKMLLSMKAAEKLGISMRAPIIYGFPGQTLKEAFQNLFFSFKLSYIGVDDVVAHAFSAHPGSELYHQLINEKKIVIEDLIRDKKYNSFMRNEFTSKMLNLHSWSGHIPDWSIPCFQLIGMFVSYIILFTFHPQKIVRTLYRTFYLKKPITVPDHVLFNLFLRKKISPKTPPANRATASSNEVAFQMS